MTITTTAHPVDTDFYQIGDLLGDDDRNLITRVRGFVDSEVLPVINEHWELAAFPYQILPALGELGIVGTAIQGYGCPGLTRLQTGLVAIRCQPGEVALQIGAVEK